MNMCACGCGKPTNVIKKSVFKMGHVKGDFYRYVQGHNGCSHISRPTKIQKVYEVDQETGCWNWLLYKNKKGYGHWLHNRKKGLAHRFFYTEKFGPIPPQMTLDHLCSNTSCVNPAHMEPVTAAENSRRKNGVFEKCLSLNFIVIRAKNEWRKFLLSLRSQTT